MSLAVSSIVALVFGLAIFTSLALVGLFVQFKQQVNVTNNKVYHLKKWLLITFILLLNAAGGVLVYYTQNLQVILFIIVVLKSKDIIMALMFVFNMIYRAITKKYYDLPSLNVSDEIERIIAFIPTFDESREQVVNTLDSVLNSKKGSLFVLPVIVSDGKSEYDYVLDKVESIQTYMYESWKNTDVQLNVLFGVRNEKPVLYIKKNKNVGKKDSIILIHDLFNYKRNNFSNKNKILSDQFKKDVNDIYGLQDFEYIFCTDGDTVIEENAILCLTETMKSQNATACSGVVNADNSQGNFFWNGLQNFQYLYGQYVRRTNEDLFNQVLCLPGCISMIKISEDLVKPLTLYSSLPDEQSFLETSVQSIGTDRRLTSSIVYNTSNAKILQDTRAHAYTTPPQSYLGFLYQRKRWTHNTYFNSLLNIFGSNVNVLLRFFNFIDVLRMSLVYFRLFNTLYFIYLLSVSYSSQNILQLVPYIVLMSYPVVCFLVYALFNSHLRNQYLSLFLFTIVNRVFSMFTNFITFTVMLFSLGTDVWKY